MLQSSTSPNKRSSGEGLISCLSQSFFTVSPPPPAPFSRGRSKLLRRNDDHPSRDRCEGGRLHHLPLPQRGLVEAGAVCPAGVPQWPDAVLDGGWKSSTGGGKSTAVFCTTERTGAQFPGKPTDDDVRTIERRALNSSHGCACPPGGTARFQTHNQVSTRSPGLRPAPTTAHLYFYTCVRRLLVVSLSQKKGEL